MTSQTLCEQDAVFPAGNALRDGLDDADTGAKLGPCRSLDMSLQTHRQAAQHRNGRLRTIAALHRPRA